MKERIEGESEERAGMRSFTTRADSRGREREREKGRERLGEWEWVSERDRARGHASGRWKGDSQRDRYINIYTYVYMQKTKGGKKRRATNTRTFYTLASCITRRASKSRARIGNEIENRGQGYTREGGKTKASRYERFDQQRESLHVSSEWYRIL